MTAGAAEAQEQPRSPRPKVVYVMGAGRSGSTILGVALGNCEGVFYAGELDKWLPRHGRPKREDERRIRFWSSVLEHVDAPESLFGWRAHTYLERSSGLLRRGGARVRSQLRGVYVKTMQDLFVAISQAAGATHVVDTSHYPLRARQLQHVQGIDLYLVLLVRDPRRVIASFAREDVVEPTFSANKTRVYLLLTYLVSVWVFCKQPRDRRMVLFHEDLLSDPRRILRAILDRIDSLSPLPDLSALDTGMALQGNRLLDRSTVAIEPTSGRDEPPQARRGPVELAITAVLSRLRPRVGDGEPARDARSAPTHA